MKYTKLFLLLLITLILTSCGHNIGTAFHGKVFNVGYDPELNKFGIQYYNGVMAVGANKENSENNLKYTDTVTIGDKTTVSEMTWSNKNGNQVTGYQVELAKVKAEQEETVPEEK